MAGILLEAGLTQYGAASGRWREGRSPDVNLRLRKRQY